MLLEVQNDAVSPSEVANTHPISLCLSEQSLGSLRFLIIRCQVPVREEGWCSAAVIPVFKRYGLRLFISLKYIKVNVVDRNNGRIVATGLTVEHSIKNTMERIHACNTKAAGIVGEVLAMRFKVEGLEQGRGIHADVNKELEKKGFKHHTKILAVVNALENNGIKPVLDDNDDRPKLF